MEMGPSFPERLLAELADALQHLLRIGWEGHNAGLQGLLGSLARDSDFDSCHGTNKRLLKHGLGSLGALKWASQHFSAVDGLR